MMVLKRKCNAKSVLSIFIFTICSTFFHSCETDDYIFLRTSDLCKLKQGETIIYKSSLCTATFVLSKKDLNAYEVQTDETITYQAYEKCTFENKSDPDFLYNYIFGNDSFSGGNTLNFNNKSYSFGEFTHSTDYGNNKDDIREITYPDKLIIQSTEYNVIIFEGTPDDYISKIYFNTNYGVMRYKLKTGETFTIQLYK